MTCTVMKVMTLFAARTRMMKSGVAVEMTGSMETSKIQMEET